MKRSIPFFLAIGFVSAWFVLQIGDGPARTNITGSGGGGGNTGSPGDGVTCANSQCHDDRSPIDPSADATITSDIPASGYIPGQTYTVTAEISKAGKSMFGFELTAEDGGTKKKGTFISTSSETQLTNGDNAVTHTSSGVSGSGSRTWTFDWEAPAAGTGEVTFYGAFNVTDANGSPSGDTVHLDTAVIPEDDASTALPSAHSLRTSSLNLHPIPAKEEVMLSGVDVDLRKSSFILRDMKGRKLKELRAQGDSGRIRLELGEVPEGPYLLEVEGPGTHSVERLLIR